MALTHRTHAGLAAGAGYLVGRHHRGRRRRSHSGDLLAVLAVLMVVPTRKVHAAVCRQSGCTVPATTSGLCDAHQAAQDRLREIMLDPAHLTTPELRNLRMRR